MSIPAIAMFLIMEQDRRRREEEEERSRKCPRKLPVDQTSVPAVSTYAVNATSTANVV